MPRPTADDRRAIILARVSTNEQAEEGFSLDAQLRLLREYAAKTGLEVVAEHRLAESARTASRRKVFRAVVRALKAPGAPRHLLVEKSDRLARNMGDTADVDALRASGLQVHFVKQGWVLGPDADPTQKMIWGVMASLDQFHVDNLSAEVKKGQREKRLQGGWTHLAPLGLVNRNAGDRRWVEHDPERAPLVRAVFDRVATEELTTDAAATFARSIGLRTRRGFVLRPNAIAALLRSPLLTGLVPLDGGWAGAKQGAARLATSYGDATWEPVVARGTWQRVQEILDGRVKGRGARARHEDRPHVLAGLLWCGSCHRKVTAELQRGREGRSHLVYYRCASSSKAACPGRVYVREERLLEQIGSRLADLIVDPSLLPPLRRALQRASKLEHSEHAEAVRRASDSKSRARDRVAAAIDAMLEGTISPAELAAVRARAGEAEAHAEIQLKALGVADRKWIDAVVRTLQLLSAADTLFLHAKPAEQRELVALLFARAELVGPQFRGTFAAPWADVETAAADLKLKRPSADSSTTSGEVDREIPVGAGHGI